MPKKDKQNKKEPRLPRPPVVSVLGHVDHGKTTLLDYIRETKVAEGEQGGITQDIGAYEITHQGQNVAFIDTPGHEAFSEMRSRGAQVADIALLLVAANEGVKAQTKEAYSYIQEADIPFIVVASKVDLETTNISKIKGELQEMGVELEEWGGDVPFVATSGVTGEGIDDLLDIILLVSEVSGLKDTSTEPFKGVVIESQLSSQRGAEATILVKAGVLQKGDEIASDGIQGKVRNMEDFQGRGVDKAPPSKPVVIIGFKDLPEVGSILNRCSDEAAQSSKDIETSLEFPIEVGPKEAKRELSLVLKTDGKGALEALLGVLKGVGLEETTLRIVDASTGNITERDVKKAQAVDKGAVVGFRVELSPSLESFAKRREVPVITFGVVYKIEKILKELLKDLFPLQEKKQRKGQVKVLALFGKRSGSRQIVGGKVTSGEVKKGNRLESYKQDNLKAEGRVAELRRGDKNISRAKKGQECGIMCKGKGKIKEGDILEVYEVKKVPPSL